MLSEKRAIFILKILIPVLIALISAVLLANKVSNSQYITETIDSLEESRNVTMEFSAATLASSLALSALPGDFSSPIAQSLADMNKYFIFIFAIIFVEKIIVMEGIKLSFKILVPVACLLFVIWVITKKKWFKDFSFKVLAFAAVIVFLIPISTHSVDKWGKDYKEYVETTIYDTQSGADKIDEIMDSASENENIFDKISSVFSGAVSNADELVDYFKNSAKKCMTSISILIVTTFAVPILVAIIFKVIISALFASRNNVNIKGCPMANKGEEA